MTGEAINRRLALAMAVHTEPHVHIDVALGNGPLRDRPMTRRALDLRADVRRVIEADVCLGGIVEHPPPDKVLAAFAHCRELPDARPVGRDRVVADHARPYARQARDGTGRHRLVAVLGATDLLAGVHVVRELEWLLRLPLLTADEVLDGFAEGRTCRREHAGALSGQNRRNRRVGSRGGVEHPAAETAGQNQCADNESAAHSRYFAGAFAAAAGPMVRR